MSLHYAGMWHFAAVAFCLYPSKHRSIVFLYHHHRFNVSFSMLARAGRFPTIKPLHAFLSINHQVLLNTFFPGEVFLPLPLAPVTNPSKLLFILLLDVPKPSQRSRSHHICNTIPIRSFNSPLDILLWRPLSRIQFN